MATLMSTLRLGFLWTRCTSFCLSSSSGFRRLLLWLLFLFIYFVFFRSLWESWWSETLKFPAVSIQLKSKIKCQTNGQPGHQAEEKRENPAEEFGNAQNKHQRKQTKPYKNNSKQPARSQHPAARMARSQEPEAGVNYSSIYDDDASVSEVCIYICCMW